MDFVFEARDKSKKGFFKQITPAGWIYSLLTITLIVGIGLEINEEKAYKGYMKSLGKRADSLGIINTIIGTENKQLTLKSDSLIKILEEKSDSNKEQLNEIKDSTSVLHSAIDNKNKEITDLENVKEYTFYSTLGINGLAPGLTPVNMVHGHYSAGSLNEKMEKVLIYGKDGEVTMKSYVSMLPIIDSVIKQYPKFPFGYIVKSNILLAHKDNRWKLYANKALEILKITTSIQGHNSQQDSALKKVNTILKDNK